jgi:MFS family permease
MTSVWSLMWPGMATLVVVMGLGRFAYTPILPEMLQAEVLSLQASGWVAAANFTGYLAGALLATLVTSRRWQQHLLTAALAASVLLLAAMPATTSPWVWSVMRFIAGMASALGLIYVSAIIFERLERLGQSALKPWVYVGVSMGMAACSLVVLALPMGLASWQTNWWAVAALGAVVAVIALLGLRPLQAAAIEAGRDAAVASGRSAPIGTQHQSRAFLAAAAAYGLFGFAYVIHATYLPAMVRAAGYPQAAANWTWVLVGLMAIPGIAFWNRIAARYGMRTAIAACYAVEGLTALAPVFSGSLGAAVMAAAGLGAVLTPVSGLALTQGRALGAGQAARVVGIMTMCFGAGQILGPIVAAYLAQGAGFAAPSAVASLALLSCSLLVFRFSADPR